MPQTLPRWICFALLGCTCLASSVAVRAQNRDPFAEPRARLVEHEVMAAGVKDERVCEAMRTTPRHEFVPIALRRYAYLDVGLPIGEGQTISQPYMVASMTAALGLEGAERVPTTMPRLPLLPWVMLVEFDPRIRL